MRLPCPHCGPREYTEFRYGGNAENARPPHGTNGHGTGDLKAWHDYFFVFDNAKGPHAEYWQHVLGCRRWFKLQRNTATNDVIGVQK